MAEKVSLAGPSKFWKRLDCPAEFRLPVWQNSKKSCFYPAEANLCFCPAIHKDCIYFSASGMKPLALPSLPIAIGAPKQDWPLAWKQSPELAPLVARLC